MFVFAMLLLCLIGFERWQVRILREKISIIDDFQEKYKAGVLNDSRKEDIQEIVLDSL